MSAKLDELAQAAPPGRQSHLGETEHDADYEQPASKSKRAPAPSAAAAQGARSAGQRSKSARNAAAIKAKADKEDEGDEHSDRSAEGSTDEEEDQDGSVHVGKDDSSVEDHKTLSWPPRRPPRKK